MSNSIRYWGSPQTNTLMPAGTSTRNSRTMRSYFPRSTEHVCILLIRSPTVAIPSAAYLLVLARNRRNTRVDRSWQTRKLDSRNLSPSLVFTCPSVSSRPLFHYIINQPDPYSNSGPVGYRFHSSEGNRDTFGVRAQVTSADGESAEKI